MFFFRQTNGFLLSNCRLERKSIILSAEECEEKQHRMVLSETSLNNRPGIISFLVKKSDWKDCTHFWTWDARHARQFQARRRRRRLAEMVFATFTI